MYDFKKKIKNYCPLDKFYWLTKIMNLFTIFLILLIFILAHIYHESNPKNKSNVKLFEGIKIGLWVFDPLKNGWILTKFSFFLMVFSAIVLFLQIALTIISIKHSNYIKLFLLTNFLLIFGSILVIFNILFVNPNWTENIRQIWWVVDDGGVRFSFNTIVFIIFITILFFCVLILYFFDISLNLKLQKKVNTYIMNKNYNNQNYKQNTHLS